MKYKLLPFFSRAELHKIWERCERLACGCLIYRHPHPQPGERNKEVSLRGEQFNVLRVVWSETFAKTPADERALNGHDVGHIPECPNTGAEGRPLCIEPSHLMLVTPDERVRVMHDRRAGYR